MDPIHILSLPVKFLPLGAIIQELTIGGRNVVLGFPKQEHYRQYAHPYFGETIGRIPNRLSGGKVCGLNGQDYEFVKNENDVTTLHGGVNGWGKKIWEGPTKVVRHSKQAHLFTLYSPDGDEGFPGAVEARVWYTVDHTGDANSGAEEIVLDIEYEAEMTGTEENITETICSLTNHGYWNIGDGPTVAGTEVTFTADLYLEVDNNQIPTGGISKFPAVNANQPTLFAENGPFIDDCFVLETDIARVQPDTRGRRLKKYISMYHPVTKIHLEASTTEPSFQFYTGDGIDVAEIPPSSNNPTSTPRRGPRSGIALEPNRYVNAANVPDWRPMVLLLRGQVWGCRNQFRLWRE